MSGFSNPRKVEEVMNYYYGGYDGVGTKLKSIIVEEIRQRKLETIGIL